MHPSTPENTDRGSSTGFLPPAIALRRVHQRNRCLPPPLPGEPEYELRRWERYRNGIEAKRARSLTDPENDGR